MVMNLYQATEFFGLSGLLTFDLGPPFTEIYFQKIPVAIAVISEPGFIDISYSTSRLDKLTATDDLDGVAFGPKKSDAKRRYIPLNEAEFADLINRTVLDYAGRIFDKRITT